MGQALNGFTQPLSDCLFQILFQTSEGRVVNIAKAPMFGALETVLEEKQNQTNKRWRLIRESHLRMEEMTDISVLGIEMCGSRTRGCYVRGDMNDNQSHVGIEVCGNRSQGDVVCGETWMTIRVMGKDSWISCPQEETPEGKVHWELASIKQRCKLNIIGHGTLERGLPCEGWCRTPSPLMEGLPGMWVPMGWCHGNH